MKRFIRYLVPKTPCNIDPLLGSALVGGISSAISAGLGALGLSNTSKENFKYNKKLMYQQQVYNIDNMWRQYDYNKQLSRYGYELENEFNSPSAQKKRMLDAGLNPYYNEQGSVAAQSNPNMQSVSQPAVSIPNFQSQSPWSAFANLPADFAQIASATKAIAEAKKVGVETKQQEAAMEDYLKTIYEKWRESKLANDYQEVITNWYKTDGKHYLDEQLRKLTVEIGDLVADGDLKGAQKLLIDAQKDKQVKDNALFDKIQTFLEQKAQYEAENAMAQVGATKAQEEMFKKQGDADAKNAETNRLRVLAENRLTNMLIENTRLDNKEKEALIDSLNSDAQVKRLIQEANDTPYSRWCIKAKTYIHNFPVIGNLLDAVGGYAAMYGAATAGSITAENYKNKPKPRVKVKGFK